MRTQPVVAGVLVVMAAWPMAALGSVIVSLNNPGSITQHEVWVEPGGTFEVDINAAPTPNMVWLKYRVAASTGSLVTLTGATLYEPWDATLSLIPLGSLTPTSDALILTVPTFGPQPVSSPVTSLSVAVAPGVQLGAYTLNLTDIYWTDSRAAEILPWSGQPGQDFVIHVVPEPASTAVLLSLGFFLVRRWS